MLVKAVEDEPIIEVGLKYRTKGEQKGRTVEIHLAAPTLHQVQKALTDQSEIGRREPLAVECPVGVFMMELYDVLHCYSSPQRSS